MLSVIYAVCHLRCVSFMLYVLMLIVVAPLTHASATFRTLPDNPQWQLRVKGFFLLLSNNFTKLRLSLVVQESLAKAEASVRLISLNLLV